MPRWISEPRKAIAEGGVNITLLGTGTSTGIPVIGCTCEVCTSPDPRDRRTRCSAFVEAGGVRLLIDAGPDFRSQALREGIPDVDAVLFTHHHFDHIMGVDDLRPFLFRNRTPIPCWALPESASVLRRVYAYIFEDGSYPGVPALDLHEIDGPFAVFARDDASRSVDVTPIPALHGTLPITGFRIGRMAYLTDVSDLPEASYALLEGLDLLILDALRQRPHATHFSIDEALDVARRIGAARTRFIHMTHSVLHARDTAALPDGVELGYDGECLQAQL